MAVCLDILKFNFSVYKKRLRFLKAREVFTISFWKVPRWEKLIWSSSTVTFVTAHLIKKAITTDKVTTMYSPNSLNKMEFSQAVVRSEKTNLAEHCDPSRSVTLSKHDLLRSNMLILGRQNGNRKTNSNSNGWISNISLNLGVVNMLGSWEVSFFISICEAAA